jgi:hypothetical protein
MTAVLLLDRLTIKPPVSASEVSVTVQESVPEPVMDALLQESVLSVCANKPAGRQQANKEQIRILDTSITSADMLAHVSHLVPADLLDLRRDYDGAAPTSTCRSHIFWHV